MRQAVLNAWARLLHDYTILMPTIIFCALVAGTLWHLSRLSSNLIQSAALQAASAHAASLKEVRKLYTSEVTDRVAGHGIQITHDYATKEGAIPLPATFSMELSKRISEESTGMQARLYSDFPFPWRKDRGPRDDFEREAIRQLRQFPDQPFYQFEDFQGHQSLRRDGAIDLPVNHPIAWRPYNGSKGNAARIGLPSRLALQQDLVLPP